MGSGHISTQGYFLFSGLWFVAVNQRRDAKAVLCVSSMNNQILLSETVLLKQAHIPDRSKKRFPVARAIFTQSTAERSNWQSNVLPACEQSH